MLVKQFLLYPCLKVLIVYKPPVNMLLPENILVSILTTRTVPDCKG